MGGLGVSVLGRAAPRLAAAFRASPEPFVLMLDDLHEVQSPACHDVLGVVIAGIPQGSQLVAASRSEQPHLPRLRASGDALEFGPSDLALDAAGAEQIFAEAHVDAHPGAGGRGDRADRGLAGRPLPRGGDRQGRRRRRARRSPATTGTWPTTSTASRCCSCPRATQRFLRRTAVLDQLCGPLCDAVLGETGAQEQLRRLEASSLFLVPLDRRREWYRYHALVPGVPARRAASGRARGRSPSCTCGRPTGTSRTDRRRWRSSTC